MLIFLNFVPEQHMSIFGFFIFQEMDNKSKIDKWELILLMFLIAFVTLTFEDKGCCGSKDGSCT